MCTGHIKGLCCWIGPGQGLGAEPGGWGPRRGAGAGPGFKSSNLPKAEKKQTKKKMKQKQRKNDFVFLFFCGMNCFLCLFFVFFLWYGLLIFWWYDLWFVAIENIQTISSPHNFKNERAENAHDLCFFVFVFWYDVWFFWRFFLRYEL